MDRSDRQTPLSEAAWPEWYAQNMHEEITVETLADPSTPHTVEDLLPQTVGCDGFHPFLEMPINCDAIDGVSEEHLPFLKLLACRGGNWLMYDGQSVPDLSDVACGEIAGCYDRLRLLGIEYPDYEKGVVGHLGRDPLTPNAVFRAADPVDPAAGSEPVYAISSATEVEGLTRSWEQTTVVAEEFIEFMRVLLDVGELRKNLDAVGFEDGGPIRISPESGEYQGVVAPRVFDGWEETEWERIA